MSSQKASDRQPCNLPYWYDGEDFVGLESGLYGDAKRGLDRVELPFIGRQRYP